MKPLARCVLAVLLLSIAPTTSSAARQVKPAVAPSPDAVRLVPGEDVQRELLPGEKHAFEVAAETNTLVRGSVDQISTDVVVKIFSPQGRHMASFDGPDRGPEEFSFFATGGTYRVEVTPYSAIEPGIFVIALEGAGEPARPLLADQAVDRTVASGDQHYYSIELEAAERAVGKVVQVGLDLSVEVWGPDGKSDGAFNNPALGPEWFGLPADSAGVSLIRVFGEGSDQVGSYTLSMRTDPDHEFDSGSSLKTLSPSSVQIENLALMGKVWGFLKYHHPAVTSGQYNWDYELFRALPGVLDAKDRAQGIASITDWATSLGEPPACNPCAPTEADIQLPAALDWLKDKDRLGARLSQFLTDVRKNRHARGSQYYVTHASGSRKPVFHNEAEYAVMEFPDAGYRLLALFRFWNMVEYWFPYRDIIGEDWGGVLAEFIPRILGAPDADAYRLQMMMLIARVHDTHAFLWANFHLQPPVGPCTLPAAFRFVEGQAVVTAVTRKQALEVGDVIQVLDGVSVPSLIEAWSPMYAASNMPTKLRNMARGFGDGECGPVSATIQRVSGTLEVALVRSELSAEETGVIYARNDHHNLPGDAFQLLSEDVAYVSTASAKAVGTVDFLRRAERTRGMVIDVRNYPADDMASALGQHLVRDTTAFAWLTFSSASDPGTFSWGGRPQIAPAEPHYQGRIVILVDDYTQSWAEYTSMVFRSAPGALVVGSTTAGADGDVSSILLPGGLGSYFSGVGVFYPDKSPTQRIGIVPDIFVEPTISGIREGRDEVLEAALREILGASADETEIRRMASHDR